MSDQKGRDTQRPSIIPRADHTVSRANISNNALKVLHRLHKGGFQSFLVGGCVRDLLLKHQPKDFDVATDASPEEVRKLFRNCRLIGRRFRLAHIHFGREIIEVATFRATHDELDDDDMRGQTDEGGRILRDNRYGELEDDVWRRDFTANALYYTLDGYSIWDFVGGFRDVEQRVLRVIGDPETRYREDPVRMLRAVRFAAKLDFSIDDPSEQPLWELGHLLADVPRARLYDEIIKMFLAGRAIESFRLLEHYRLLIHLFPALVEELEKDKDGQFRKLLLEGLATTDQRVREDKPVTTFFLFAVLLWAPIKTRFDRLHGGGMPPIPAMQRAVEEIVKAQQQRISVPRRTTIPMQEMLALQSRFNMRKGVRSLRFLHHPRFRAAYDFMLLRASCSDFDGEAAQWWTDIQLADEKAQREMAQVGGDGGSGKRKRKPRRRGGRKRSREQGAKE
ncbi:MAG: polynucleotide adenylyltransferase PcnB [Gammaproteobacteria bacterium]|nr:polynucleotide adenylyltransferase PcnB [Gammaproteobacteria bacterium]